MNNLIVYGDSWPFGSGLDNPCNEAFPFLLGKHLNLNVLNCSVPATSIDHLVFYFLKNYKEKNFKENDRVLFCLTGQARALRFDENNKPRELHPRGASEFEKAYYKYVHSKTLAEYNLQKNILFCKLLCDSINLKSFFISNWEPIPADIYGDCNFYPLSLLGILHPERNHELEDKDGISKLWDTSPYMFKHRHPNAAGHQKIANELAKWIN